MKKSFSYSLWLVTVLFALSLPPAASAQALVCAQGASGVAPIATIIFTPPVLNSDGSALSLPLTYNIYQSALPGLEVKVATAQKGSPISISTGLTPRTTYYFRLSVSDASGNESGLSNEVCKTFPGSVPGTVTITIS